MILFLKPQLLILLPTAGEQVNQTETTFQRHSIYDAIYDFYYDEFDNNCVAIISDSDNFKEVEPVNMHIRIGNTETKSFVDSGGEHLHHH